LTRVANVFESKSELRIGNEAHALKSGCLAARRALMI
jgi:hypothetical protein